MTPPAELTARNGTIGIGSPEHPGYATYEHCAWVIKAGDNSRVRMWYTFLDLPYVMTPHHATTSPLC